ncbi:MAG TPA: hypothetical protein VMV69_23800 [Pirellulales bacterium]|nr:hypothetical protein [Pirellulales bacterium]
MGVTKQAHHTAAVCAAQRTHAHQLLRIGRHVSLARKRLQGDEWTAWLADVGYTLAEGEILVTVGDRFSVHPHGEELSPGALLAPAAADVPREAIAEAVSRSRRGQVVSFHLARQLVERHRTSACSQRPGCRSRRRT